MDESQPFPKTKQEIIAAYNMGAARQFHGKIFDVGHKATNYFLYVTRTIKNKAVLNINLYCSAVRSCQSVLNACCRWTSTNVEDGPAKVSHPITLSQTYLYEPFYVSSDSIPPFDERFLGYGFTRNSQVFQENSYKTKIETQKYL